jgi:hypothetical protein
VLAWRYQYNALGFNDTIPVLWKNGQVTDIGLGQLSLPGGYTLVDQDAVPTAINNSEAVLGMHRFNCTNSDGGQIFGAFDALSNGGAESSFSCGSFYSVAGGLPWGICDAVGLNDQNVAVGDYAPPPSPDSNPSHAYTWPGGGLADPGACDSIANAINNKNQIVGRASFPPDCAGAAVLWQNGTMFRLSDLLPPGAPVLNYATAINDVGQIIAVSSPNASHPNSTEYWLVTLASTDKTKLTIQSIVPNQGVDCPDITGNGRPDLVANRPTLVKVRIVATGPAAGSIAPPLELAFQDDATTHLPTNQVPTPEGFAYDYEFFLQPGLATGQYDRVDALTATIDPDGTLASQDVAGIGTTLEAGIEIKQVNPFFVAYVPVTCVGALTTDQYLTTAQQGSEYMAAMFPVDPATLSTPIYPAQFQCLGPKSLDKEWHELWQLGKTLSFGQADRVVGIADGVFMDTRFPDNPITLGISRGLCDSPTPTAFVRVEHWDSIPHEIGHTLGLSHPFEAQSTWCLIPPWANLDSSFWVERDQPIALPSSLMDHPPANADFDFPSRWITKEDYAALFQFRFRSLLADPEVLLLAATLHQDGSVEWAPLYRLPSGKIDAALPGNYAVEILDRQGNASFSEAFSASFTNTTLGDWIPIQLAIPYPWGTATIRLVHGTNVLSSFRPDSKLLRDAVASVPDVGFAKDAATNRGALLSKIDAFDQQLAVGALHGARQKLENEIQKHLLDWLSDYRPSSPLQVSKSDILNLAAEIDQRLVH